MSADATGAADAPLSPERSAALVEVFDEARSWGFLGPGLLSVHIEHALGFAAAIGGRPGSVADLGSGGGVPGLVLAAVWEGTRILLIEANQRRAEFLVRSVHRLDLGDRVEVAHDRAESAGRGGAFRHSFEVVTARGFGPPAVTAECAAGLLGIAGRLVVSEPPGGDPERWDVAGLERLGFGAPAFVVADAAFAVLTRTTLVEEFPRRMPGKRPLW